MAGLRKALLEVPIFAAPRAIQPGERWQGFVSFPLYTQQPLSKVELTFTGTRDGDAVDSPLRFDFVAQRRPPRKCSRPGEVASALGVCPSDVEGYDPPANGPCIQETRTYGNSLRRQIWVAGSPVADSDLYRTLKSQDISQTPTQRGLRQRAIGWLLVGMGLASSVAIIAGLSTNVTLRSDASAGLSGLALSLVGLGFAYHGQQLIHEGVVRYNQSSETSGVCAPVW